MSAHFSKFSLNTYCGAPYFSAHVPESYPLSLVLQKCRAFRRLPPNLRKLSVLAKQWALRTQAPEPGGPEIDSWYDDAGNELDPDTGKPLTDAEIDAEWAGLEPPDVEVKDIPAPEGGFPDPETWRPKEQADAEEDIGGDDGPTESQILSDIAGHGRARTAAQYGVTTEQLAGLASDKQLAQFILQERG